MLSAGLSGTCNLVRRLGEEFEGLEIKTFDTVSGSLGTGGIALRLSEYIRQGRPWGELLELTPKLIENTHVFFSVNTLEYLRKGGRIGQIAAVAGTLLQIKPIISFAENGELSSVAKIRGRKAAVQKMVQMAAACVPRGAAFNLAVAHGDSPDELREIRRMAQKSLPDFQFFTEGEIDCTLGAYVGPHLLGVGVQLLDEAISAAERKNLR